MAAESISCTTPKPQRSTSEPVTKHSGTCAVVKERHCTNAMHWPEVVESATLPNRHRPIELVVVLGIFGEQDGGADRAPGLPPEGLHYQTSVSGSSLKQTVPPASVPEASPRLSEAPDEILVLIQAVDAEALTACCMTLPAADGVDAETGRLVHEVPPTWQSLPAPPLSGLDSDPGIGGGRRDLDAVPISRVEHGEIPEIGVVVLGGQVPNRHCIAGIDACVRYRKRSRTGSRPRSASCNGPPAVPRRSSPRQAPTAEALAEQEVAPGAAR